jgi:hypothetical protein
MCVLAALYWWHAIAYDGHGKYSNKRWVLNWRDRHDSERNYNVHMRSMNVEEAKAMHRSRVTGC